MFTTRIVRHGVCKTANKTNLPITLCTMKPTHKFYKYDGALCAMCIVHRALCTVDTVEQLGTTDKGDWNR